jgi:hypothetical protein
LRYGSDLPSLREMRTRGMTTSQSVTAEFLL